MDDRESARRPDRLSKHAYELRERPRRAGNVPVVRGSGPEHSTRSLLRNGPIVAAAHVELACR
jgi:hypothetical protein